MTDDDVAKLKVASDRLSQAEASFRFHQMRNIYDKHGDELAAIRLEYVAAETEVMIAEAELRRVQKDIVEATIANSGGRPNGNGGNSEIIVGRGGGVSTPHGDGGFTPPQ